MALLEVFRIICALLIVLGMIGACALLARRFGVSGQIRLNNTRKRLTVVESISLDNKRRLAIIRCDQREHLIVLNAGGETVIENNIPPAAFDLDKRASEISVTKTDKTNIETEPKNGPQSRAQPELQNPFSALIEKHFKSSDHNRAA